MQEKKNFFCEWSIAQGPNIFVLTSNAAATLWSSIKATGMNPLLLCMRQ